MAKHKVTRLMTPLETAVQENTKRLLDASPHTQRALARALGHKDSWASDFLKGKRPISLADADRVAHFFGAAGIELLTPPGGSHHAQRSPSDADAALTTSQALRDGLESVLDTVGRLLSELTRLERLELRKPSRRADGAETGTTRSRDGLHPPDVAQ